MKNIWFVNGIYNLEEKRIAIDINQLYPLKIYY